MTTFVLVHGGGHGGWCWQPLVKQLRSSGHEVYAPTLTGLADRQHLLHPGINLDTHIQDICSLLQFEDLTDVVLVGHSYGGMVITGVADLSLERVSGLVYLDAAIPHSGESLLDVSPGLNNFKDIREVHGVRLGLWPDANIIRLYGITDPAQIDWVLPKLTPHPWATFEQKLQLNHPDEVKRVKRAIMNCTLSLRNRPDQTASRWLSGDLIKELDAGHDLMLVEPKITAQFLYDFIKVINGEII